MRGARWAIVAVALLSACTKHNPRACANGLCTDPGYPFCDVDGSFSGTPDTCIAVNCTPMEFKACRGNDSITCNATGDNYDITQCEGTCDPMTGCITPRVLYIAFVSDRDGNGEIYRMNPDGSMPTNLTRNPAADQNPIWDQTGDHIAFLSNRSGTMELYVMDADGNNVRNLSQGDATDFAWSPAGTQLAFSSNRTGNAELYTVHSDGTMLKRITLLGTVGAPDWSPDGSKIVFVSNAKLYVIGADGSNLTPITAGVDRFPRWSPDGSKIAFGHRITFTNNDVYLVNPDGSGAIDITNTASATEDEINVWSPDGTAIAGTGGNDPDTEVFAVDPSGANYRNVSMSPSSRDGNPCWSPDGSSIVFESERTGNLDLFLISANGGVALNLTMSMSGDGGCSWRPR